MPRYRLKKEVPWGEVLDILSWHLDMKIRHYNHCLKLYNDGGLSEKLLESHKMDIKKSYRAYHDLRCFLGYSTNTKLGEEAVKIID